MELQESPEVEELNEKIKTRREARRRKILENAKSRLEKLNFLTQETCEYSDPEVEPDIPEHLQMPFRQFETTFRGFDDTINHSDLHEKEKPFIKYKLHVVLAVTIAYIASLILNVNEERTFYVIIPVTLVIICDLTIFQQRQQNPMIHMLVLFGIRSQEIVHALSMAGKIQNIVTDLSIFIFYFCIATCFGNQFVRLADIK
ncbi:uncharacterized protein LOC118736638 isoform X2 [Rhagoletis pomonella]|uniref:uncharacterized protein LOC118736638 isoform X2 n=1 Tax=Rhagoletis pomonella TaxID=28610 RepID=UPI00177B8A4D|nr:uncharacterized protein LOC118736638 isoform X2 [Rhagoletis pomonella]